MFLYRIAVRHAGDVVTDDPRAPESIRLSRVLAPWGWQGLRLGRESVEQFAQNPLRLGPHPVHFVVLVHALKQERPQRTLLVGQLIAEPDQRFPKGTDLRSTCRLQAASASPH